MTSNEKLDACHDIAKNGSPEAAAWAVSTAIDLSAVKSDIKGDVTGVLNEIIELAIKQGHPKSFLYIGNYYKATDLALSLSYFDRGGAMGDVHCLNMAGNICLNDHAAGSPSESYRLAESYYRKSLEADPENGPSAVGMAIFRAGDHERVLKWCDDDLMRNRPDEIYRLAEYAHSFDETFGREVMKIADEKANELSDWTLAIKTRDWMHETDPEVVKANQAASRKRREASRKRIQEQQRVNQQIRDNDRIQKQMEEWDFRQWRQRQR